MMERETGIEPATSSLGSWRSTAELLPLRFMILAATSNHATAKAEEEFWREGLVKEGR